MKISEIAPSLGTYIITDHTLKEIPNKGTLTGRIWRKDIFVDHMHIDSYGKVKLPDYGKTIRICAIRGTIKDNVITLIWNQPPGNCDISVSYEYGENMKKEFNIYTPKFETFLSYQEILDIQYNAETVGAWDFANSIGDTIMEKYESLYIKLVEITNILISKGAAGYFWITTSPEIIM